MRITTHTSKKGQKFVKLVPDRAAGEGAYSVTMTADTAQKLFTDAGVKAMRKFLRDQKSELTWFSQVQETQDDDLGGVEF